MTLFPLENVFWIPSHLLTNEVVCLFIQQSPPGAREEKRWGRAPQRADLMLSRALRQVGEAGPSEGGN